MLPGSSRTTAERRPRHRWRRRIATVTSLTAEPTGFLLSPRPGIGVCADCFNLTRGFTRCYACTQAEQHLAAFVPVSYSVAHEQLHNALWSYKRLTGPRADHASRTLAAILWRFLVEHERCLAQTAGVERFDLVTTVPSGDRQRDQRHPLRAIVGEMVAPTRDRHDRLLQRTEADITARQFDADRFEAVRALDGQSVLLIDDTWTTGASMQSAAAALRRGGAQTVAAIAVGRHINRDWHENARQLDALSRPFDWSTCVACRAGRGLALVA